MRTVFKYSIQLFFLATFCLCSCLGEGDLDCDAPSADQQILTLEFKHNINPASLNTIAEVVDSIDIYIYKENEELLRVERLYSDELAETDYLHTLILDKGTYTIAAWMNSSNEYVFENTQTLSEASNRIVCDGERRISKKINSALYYGYDDKNYQADESYKNTTVTLDWFPEHRILNFARNTNNIQVDAIFDRILPTGTKIEAYITGKNGVTNFVNKCPEADPVYTYSQYDYNITNETKVISGYTYYSTHSSYLNTQRIWQDDGLNLTILMIDESTRATPVVLIDQPLTPLIMKNPAYYSDRQLEIFHDYLLEFVFEKNRDQWGHVEIKVNGWYTININANLELEPK